MRRDACFTGKTEQGVGVRNADAANVIRRVPRVETGGAVHELRGVPARLPTGDSRRLVDAEVCCRLLGRLSGNGIEERHGFGVVGQRGVVALTRDVHAEEAVFVTGLHPPRSQVGEVRERGLNGPDPRSEPHLVRHRLLGVLGPHDRCRQVAELPTTTLARPRVGGLHVAEENLAAGVPTSITLAGGALVRREHEEPALARTALLESRPLLVEDRALGLLVPKRRVVRHVTARRELALRPILRMTHGVVVGVGKRNESRTTHTARHDNFAHHARNVVALKGGQLPPLRPKHRVLREVEQPLQRLGAGSTPALHLQGCARLTDARVVVLDHDAAEPMHQAVVEGVGPPLGRVLDGVVDALALRACDRGEVADELPLDGEANPAAHHENVEQFRERLEVVEGHEGAVVEHGVVAASSVTRRPQGAHGGQHVHAEHGLAEFPDKPVGKIALLLQEGEVAIDALGPCLAPTFFLHPPCIGARVDELGQGVAEGRARDLLPNKRSGVGRGDDLRGRLYIQHWLAPVKVTRARKRTPLLRHGGGGRQEVGAP